MAEYIPITDQEIEPEAPLTSILQHKLRDNPIAIAEGATGAPIFQVWAESIHFSTFERLFSVDFTGNITLGGGLYGFNMQLEVIAESGVRGIFRDVRQALTFQIEGLFNNLFVEFAKGAGGNGNGKVLVHYHSTRTTYNYTWLFVLVDKTSGNIEGMTYQPHHISYGNNVLLDHPFVGTDTTNKDIFVVNITKEDDDTLKIKRMPKIGGGFFSDVSTFDYSLIDYTRPPLSMIEVFLNNYIINYSQDMPWLSAEKFNVLMPYFDNNFPFLEIQEPAMVTRVGYSLK